MKWKVMILSCMLLYSIVSMLLYRIKYIEKKYKLWQIKSKFFPLDKSTKATTNSTNTNDNNKCFQYAATFASNHNEVGKNEQKYQKLNFLYINNWKVIKFPSGKDD